MANVSCAARLSVTCVLRTQHTLCAEYAGLGGGAAPVWRRCRRSTLALLGCPAPQQHLHKSCAGACTCVHHSCRCHCRTLPLPHTSLPLPFHPLQLLSTDPNFIRLAKGAYSLHCFHPDKEQLVRVQPPKEPKSGKKAAGAAGDGATPAAGGEGGEGGATPAAAKKEKEAVPMQRVEAKSLEVGAGGLECARTPCFPVQHRPRAQTSCCSACQRLYYTPSLHGHVRWPSASMATCRNPPGPCSNLCQTNDHPNLPCLCRRR